MKHRNYYSATSLERPLAFFEERYGMSSADFYAAHLASPHEAIPEVPGFHRHVWASFYRDARRMRGDDFAEHAERMLAGKP